MERELETGDVNATNSNDSDDDGDGMGGKGAEDDTAIVNKEAEQAAAGKGETR